ncbi:MAG: Glycine/sarcosine N-methyltransferase [Chlamydiae bacterium]|nr:Glycine/sarcosine N-methyltransferase [Chlamydiota bacterium]
MKNTKKNKLGLPLEYSKLSKYFDLLSQDNDNDTNRTLEKILSEYKVKTVLDLTCGTGSQVFWLTKHGYKVTGADLSPELLMIARDNAQKDKIDITFIEGDMQTIEVGKFDAVITIFNAVGHLTKAEFEKTLRNICRNLKHGGLYIFDIFNLDAMTDHAVNNLAMDVRKSVNETHIHHVQKSKLDRDSGLLTSYDEYLIQKGSQEPKIYKGKFTLQIYTANELKEMLSRNGFECLDHYGIDGSQFSRMKTQNILTVAKKK